MNCDNQNSIISFTSSIWSFALVTGERFSTYRTSPLNFFKSPPVAAPAPFAVADAPEPPAPVVLAEMVS